MIEVGFSLCFAHVKIINEYHFIKVFDLRHFANLYRFKNFDVVHLNSLILLSVLALVT